MDKKQLLEDKFMTAARFSQEVEKIAFDNPEMNYIDSVIHYCELNEIELDSVNKLIVIFGVLTKIFQNEDVEIYEVKEQF